MTERKVVSAEALKAAKAKAAENFGTLILSDAQIELLLQAAGREIAAKAVKDFADSFEQTAVMINVPKSIYLHVTAIAKRYALDILEGKRLR